MFTSFPAQPSGEEEQLVDPRTMSGGEDITESLQACWILSMQHFTLFSQLMWPVIPFPSSTDGDAETEGGEVLGTVSGIMW
jgi:hypothetical protein